MIVTIRASPRQARLLRRSGRSVSVAEGANEEETRMRQGFLMSVVLLVAVIVNADVAAADRHEGYYYPTVTSRETYVARAITLPDSDRARRIGFIVGPGLPAGSRDLHQGG